MINILDCVPFDMNLNADVSSVSKDSNIILIVAQKIMAKVLVLVYEWTSGGNFTRACQDASSVFVQAYLIQGLSKEDAYSGMYAALRRDQDDVVAKCVKAGTSTINPHKNASLLFDLLDDKKFSRILKMIEEGAEVDVSDLEGISLLEAVLACREMEGAEKKDLVTKIVERLDVERVVVSFRSSLLQRADLDLLYEVLCEVFESDQALDHLFPLEQNLLHLAVRNKALEAVEFLLEKRPNWANQLDAQLRLPLDHALFTVEEQHTCFFLCKALLPKMNENIRHEYLIQALNRGFHQIAEGKEIVQQLIQKVQNPNLFGENGENCLHSAIRAQDLELIQLLLNNGLDLTMQTMQGKTPLQLALETENEGIVNELIGRSQGNQEALHGIALAQVPLKFVKSLMQAGVAVTQGDLNRAIVDENIPLLRVLMESTNCHFLITNDFLRRVIAYEAGSEKDQDDNTKTILEILVQGLSFNEVDLPNDTGQTLLHQAIYFGWTRMVATLVIKGANPLAKNQAGETPLDLAIERGEDAIIAALIDNLSADKLDSQDEQGNTLLHKAAYNGWVQVVLPLLIRGANPLVPNQSGQTPLDVAVTGGREFIIRPIQHRARELGWTEQPASNIDFEFTYLFS